VTVAGNVTLSGLSGGEHTLKVYAWDEARNIGVSETASFTVTTFPIALIAAGAAVVATVSIGILFYFKRHRTKNNRAANK